MSQMDLSEQGGPLLDAEGKQSAPPDFYVVGIGASAGGLEALEQIFEAMPEDSSMAFVVVQHLSPDFKSLMDELLARHTRMPIHRVEDGMAVEPNSLYLLPPKQEMIISSGRLLLSEKDTTQVLSLPIDHFFRSLAQDMGPRGIAVVLSGTGSDGSRGIRDVHEAGGLVVVQAAESAKFDGMPKSALDTGVVDIEIEPSRIPAVLKRYVEHPFPSELQATNEELVASNEELQSTNEELHSVNEELYTVNAEYQRKIGELTELNNDMDNLLVSTKVHTLFLDKQLCIRKFTPDIAPVFNLINSDIGRRIDGFTHKLACHHLLDKLGKALAGNEQEEEVRDCDGRHYLMRVLPYLSNSKPEGVVLTLVDITERKVVEDELSVSKRSLGQERTRLQTVLDQSLCIIYLKDTEARYIELNQFGADNLGKSREEIIGHTDLELMEERGGALHEKDLRVISTGERQTCEVEILTPCGGRIFYYLKSPLRDAHGAIVGSCGIAIDITERKEAEALLAQEIARRDEFLAMLSHELRNPMGAVLNALEVLQSECDCHGASEAPGRIIKRQTRHMARLLDDLLDVARIGQNKIEFRKEVVDLAHLADDVLEAVAYEVNTKDQVLHTTICSGPLPVFADPARIKQAQVNLLTNASTYTPPTGDIWYGIDREDEEAIITVQDSGEGIPHELLNSIFDLFVQSESSLARCSGGMGVGLSLARSIVEAHGGSIVAESEGPTRGSTFRIRLPVTKLPLKSTSPTSRYSFRGYKLLLVEDNDDARTMLAKALRLKEFDVAHAADGEAALKLFRSFQPHVAVVDIGLPVMNGYQLAREVRKMDEFSETLLVALTGYGREADRQAALEAGFDAHLVKPLDPTALYSLIARKDAARETM